MPDIRPISDALSNKARDELFEVSERIAADIETIRSWINIQPHLKSRVDDQFIITFLRGCKYSLERTKEKLNMFYTVRTAIPEFHTKRDPHLEILYLIRLGVGVPLPMTDGIDGPRLVLYRPGVYDPNKVRAEDIMRYFTMLTDILLMEDDQTVIAGLTGVLDMVNVTMAHFLQFHPAMLKKVALVSQDGSPLRQKGYHYVNTPTGFHTAFNIFKGFLGEKIRTRLYVHGDNMESLYEHVPKKLMPLEYGGDAGPIQNLIDEWEKKFISYTEYFKEEEQYGCDESKRIGEKNIQETLFGVEGSFRKLDID